MKILCCFKIVPDLDLIAGEDWIADDQLQVDISYGKLLWNCFDEGALEMMLKLSDISEGFDVVYELNALTVGRRQHETFLKTLYALGFAHGVRVETEENISFCPDIISDIVADYVEGTPQDAIVMGMQSSDGSNMKTPAVLAEKLGWPCITQVTGLEPVDEQHLKVISREDGKIVTQVVKLPYVFAVGNASCAYLRVPTLKDKMKLGRKPIEHIVSERLSPDRQDALRQGQDVELVGLKSLDSSRDTVLITGGSPEDKARELYETYLKGRLEKR